MTRQEIEQLANKTGKLHMRLGQNVGKILLEIAQTAIQDGNPVKAIKTYTDSINGFTEEYVIKILKNEYVLTTSNDGKSMDLVNSEKERITNRTNITNWNIWVNKKLDTLVSINNTLNKVSGEFEKHVYKSILDYDITNSIDETINSIVYDIAAKLIADLGFSSLTPVEANIWDELCIDVETDSADKYQYALYFIVQYVDSIRILHKEYIKFINAYMFLMNNNIIERPLFFEDKIEAILDKLTEFADTTKGYYHSLCDTKLYKYKESIDDDILSTEYGKEYHRNGALEKNIMDGYDAGWLSPDGKFYGENGTASNLIHLRIAEKLSGGNMDGDIKLEKNGWIKIRGNEVYGSFIGSMTPKKDFSYPYCPTDVQIKIICDYIDNLYTGKLYTQPQIVQVTKPITTYKLRQMDNIKLHELFTP